MNKKKEWHIQEKITEYLLVAVVVAVDEFEFCAFSNRFEYWTIGHILHKKIVYDLRTQFVFGLLAVAVVVPMK